MKRVREDLWQTSLRVAEGVNTAGYLLRRPAGNVLFYDAPDEERFAAIAALGGVSLHVLSHRHETSPLLEAVKLRFGSRLCSDAFEAPAIREQSKVDVDVVIEEGEHDLEGLEILPTRGHTAGGLTCRYRSPHGETYLFCGDTIIPVAGHWIAQYVPAHGGDAARLTASLLRLRDVEPDLVLSSSTVGDETVLAVGRDAWPEAVDSTAAREPLQG